MLPVFIYLLCCISLNCVFTEAAAVRKRFIEHLTYNKNNTTKQTIDNKQSDCTACKRIMFQLDDKYDKDFQNTSNSVNARKPSRL